MDDGSAWTILIDHTVFGLLELKHSFVFVEKNQVVSLKNDATMLFYILTKSLTYYMPNSPASLTDLLIIKHLFLGRQ